MFYIQISYSEINTRKDYIPIEFDLIFEYDIRKFMFKVPTKKFENEMKYLGTTVFFFILYITSTDFNVYVYSCITPVYHYGRFLPYLPTSKILHLHQYLLGTWFFYEDIFKRPYFLPTPL